ncbi:MAG: precorrin-8X methylmutase [Rhodobacteraceae bacterium]|nr:precorrin-8X methylmutase [Paracoccaceae bacterium]
MIYEKNPQKIYEKSFCIIQNEVDLSRFPPGLRDIAIRIIHACGMTNIIEELRYSDSILKAGLSALNSKPTIFCDTYMTANGIIQSFLPPCAQVVVSVDSPEVYAHAKSSDTTRSAASVDYWYPKIEGSIVVIGNAPTALFRLLELIRKHNKRPSLVIATPVGFVGASESKLELANNVLGLDFITVLGRRGGSAIAAAIVNALSSINQQKLEFGTT